MFLVVEFTDENQLAVIPDCWIDKDGRGCASWPPYNFASKITKAARLRVIPTREWRSYRYRLLENGSFDTYEQACKKLKLAEEFSDLGSTKVEERGDERPKRRTVPPSRFNNPDFVLSWEDVSAQPLSQNDDDSVTFEQACKKLKKLAEEFSDLGSTKVDDRGDERPKRRSVPPSRFNNPEFVLPWEDVSPQPLPQNDDDSAADLGAPSVMNQQQLARCMEKNIALLEGLHQRMDRMECKMEQIVQIVLPDVQTLELPEGIDLPLMTREEMTNINCLLDSPQYMTNMVQCLKVVGGMNVKETTNNILSRIFSPGLAINTNWSGKGGKVALESTPLESVIYRSVRLNARSKMATDAEIKKCCQDWLKNSSDRNGGRKKRERE